MTAKREINVVFMPVDPPDSPCTIEGRTTPNVWAGDDVLALERFLMNDMPGIDSDAVTNHYDVRWTQRTEDGPRSFPRLEAIVRVWLTGQLGPEWPVVEGFYSIKLFLGIGGRVDVEYCKLVKGETIQAAFVPDKAAA